MGGSELRGWPGTRQGVVGVVCVWGWGVGWGGG